ncbi:phosphatidylinositol 4-kinase [Candidatus Bathyarchaeota archaeon]|nr:phosphatidylinositol 4-kinase [Candidatus Bathyarchaeota archaeon]
MNMRFTYIDEDIEAMLDVAKKPVVVTKGGPGSGFEGHAGIHGHQGGSAPAGGFVDDKPEPRYSEKELKKYLVHSTADLSKTQYGYGGFFSPDGNLYDSKPTHAAFVREVLKMGTTKALSDEDQKFFEEMGKLRHESEVIAILNGWDRVDVSKNETNFQTKFTDTTTLRRIQKYYTDGKVKASLDGQVVWEGMLHRDVFGDKVVSNIGYFRGTHSVGGATMMTWRELLTYDKVKFNADGEAVFKEKKMKVILHPQIVEKGGAGSGFRGHQGRPGEVGGSAPEGGFVSSKPKVRLVRSRFGKKYSNMTNLRRPPKQGAFRSDLADIPGDGTVILKYKEYKKFRQPKEGSDGLQSDYRSDVESYRAAEQMGFKKLVPVTERVLNPDTGEKCAALEFITGDIRTVAKSAKFTDIAVDQFSELAVLDTITGNRDRHGGNLLVDQGTGKVHAIDNSLSFHDNLKRHLPGVEAGAKWYNKISRKNDFHVLPQHIAAGDRLVNNSSWRKRIVQKFDKAALTRVDARWAEFKGLAVKNGWWSASDESALQAEYGK